MKYTEQYSKYTEQYSKYIEQYSKYIEQYSKYIQYPILLLFPFFINYIVHYSCNYFNCNEWYSLFGLHLGCNACIDIKKYIKDNQITIYCSLGTYILLFVSKYSLYISSNGVI